MAGYQIFVPDVRGSDPEHLRRVGLDGILDKEFGSPAGFDVLNGGPGGLTGVCFAWLDGRHSERDPQRPGVHLEHQIWAPCKPRGDLPAARFWMGRDRGVPIRPEDLARRTQQPGLPVKLDDGQEWLVPSAICLPHRYGLDDQGRETRVVVEGYREFYEKAEHYFNVLPAMLPIGPGASIKGGWEFAIEALALNYRVNRDLVDWLRLFSEVSLLWTIGATFELDQLRAIEAQKKTA